MSVSPLVPDDQQHETAEFLGKLAGPHDKGKRAHFCASCNFPASKHARCAPCLHVFCSSCAANMPRCLVCNVLITKVEPIPAGATLFVSPATLQGYHTEAEFMNSIRAVAARVGGKYAGAAESRKS